MCHVLHPVPADYRPLGGYPTLLVLQPIAMLRMLTQSLCCFELFATFQAFNFSTNGVVVVVFSGGGAAAAAASFTVVAATFITAAAAAAAAVAFFSFSGGSNFTFFWLVVLVLLLDYLVDGFDL